MKQHARLIPMMWIFLMFTSLSALAQKEAPVSTITDVNATVTLVADQYTLVPDDNDSQRYMPRNMDAKYKKDGLQVTVSGNVFAIPPNVRMIGTPFEITKIFVRNTPGNVQPPPKPTEEGTNKPHINTEVKPSDATVTTNMEYAEVSYTTKLTNIKGTIVLMGNTFLIETDKGMRYYPMNLPAEFKVEKQKVLFNGMSGSPPPNVRMKGHPLKISEINKVEPKKWWQFWK